MQTFYLLLLATHHKRKIHTLRSNCCTSRFGSLTGRKLFVLSWSRKYYIFNTAVLNRDDFAPQGKFGHVWRPFWLLCLGGERLLDLWWAKTRDVSKHPTARRTLPTPHQGIVLPQMAIVLRLQNLAVMSWTVPPKPYAKGFTSRTSACKRIWKKDLSRWN